MGGFAPDQLPGICPAALLAGQENTIITQTPHHLLATAQGRKTRKHELDGSLHLQIGRFAHASILQADQPRRHMLLVATLLNLATSPSIHTQAQGMELCFAQKSAQAQ